MKKYIIAGWLVTLAVAPAVAILGLFVALCAACIYVIGANILYGLR